MKKKTDCIGIGSVSSKRLDIEPKTKLTWLDWLIISFTKWYLNKRSYTILITNSK